MKLRYAMVCSSNQNRSTEAHSILERQGFDVSSYGTGSHVKLPGPSLREPNAYDFGTPYKQMFDDLRRKDPDLHFFLPNALRPVNKFTWAKHIRMQFGKLGKMIAAHSRLLEHSLFGFILGLDDA